MKIRYRKNKIFLVIPTFVILMGIFFIPQTAYFAYITENSIIDLTNSEREKIGANELIRNDALDRAAQKKGEDILKNQIFKHNFTNRQFSDWIRDENYKYSHVGENLAIDFATNTGVIEAWLNSESHKKNLLNKNFREIGVAIVEGKFRGENTTIVIQVFGSPLNSLSINNGTDSQSLLINQYLLDENQNNSILEQQKIAHQEQENNIYQLLSQQKLIYKKFNPLSNSNIRITTYVTIFYSVILLLIYFVQKKQLKKVVL